MKTSHIRLYSLDISKFILKLLISQSKFSGPKKLTLRYQLFQITEVKNVNEN